MKKIALILLTALSISANAQTKQSNMKEQKNYTIMLLMNATAKWLSLSRAERSAFFEKEVLPIFSKVGENTKINLYDSEYFHSSVSDFMIINTTHLDEYELIIELLRDTKIYGAPYFDIKDIIIGQENLFESFNEKFKSFK